MFLKRLVSIKSLKLKIMTYLIMMLKYNQFLMFYSINQLSKLHSRLRRNMNLKILESLSMSTTNVAN